MVKKREFGQKEKLKKEETANLNERKYDGGEGGVGEDR